MLVVPAVIAVMGLIGVALYLKFGRSKMMNSIIDELIEGPKEKNEKDLVSDAQEADVALNKKVQENEKEVKKILEGNEIIKKYKEGDKNDAIKND